MVPQMDAEAREAEALRDINRLVYLAPSQGGLMDQRTDIVYYFNNQTCTPGDTILANGNSGSLFGWGPNCFLKLVWTVTNSAGAAGSINFGYGSIMNLIKEIRLTHSSGEVLEYIQNANLLAAIKTRYETSSDDQIKLSALLGGVDTTAAGSTYGGGFVFDLNTFASIAAGGTSQVFVAAASSSTFTSLIPMSYLLGTFARCDQYIPPPVLAGSTLQIVLAPAAEAYSVSAATMSVSLIRPSLIYDTSKAYDTVMRSILNDQSSMDGLQFVYSTYFNTYITTSTSSVNFQIQQAATITENVFAVFRPATAAGSTLTTFLPLAQSYQWRIASDFKPQQSVNIGVINATPTTAESYMQMLKTFETGLHSYSTPVGYGAGLSIYGYNTFGAAYGTTLERTACGLSLTGLPTNNMSLLNFEATFFAAPGAPVRVDVFLKYVRVVNTRGNSATVDK